jgi:hypothetical protein
MTVQGGLLPLLTTSQGLPECFHENQRQDSQAYQELCHIDED